MVNVHKTLGRTRVGIILNVNRMIQNSTWDKKEGTY